MSVGPVRPGSVGPEPPSPDKKVPLPANSASAVAEKTANVETASAQNSPIVPLFPEHEVKVQDDSSTDNVLVYRTVDKKSGDLVVQVPSAEVLKELQENQELVKQLASREKAATRAAAPVAAPGADLKGEGKINGSKL